jgi:S-formylglutathione hydrolase
MARELSRHKSFGGYLIEYEHDSAYTHTPMKFAIYHPPNRPHPTVLFYLAGLTRSHLRFPESSSTGLQVASQLGLALAFADTSPRNLSFPGFSDREEIGNAASFYLDATESPWSQNFQMYSYLVKEWIPEVAKMLSADAGRMGVFGHSMGGQGALVLALRNPGMFRSVSAFAPVAHPTAHPFGQAIYTQYLGNNSELWKLYDATELVKSGYGKGLQARIDIAGNDELAETLLVEDLEKAAQEMPDWQFIRHEGYQHGSPFVTSVIGEVLRYHASLLQAP